MDEKDGRFAAGVHFDPDPMGAEPCRKFMVSVSIRANRDFSVRLPCAVAIDFDGEFDGFVSVVGKKDDEPCG
jgi:hypothetical protein